MKNIHILPTDKPSRVYLIKSNNRLGITSDNPEFTENFGSGTQNQHIYITSDEVKKYNEWVLSNLNEVVRFCSLYCQNSYKKVILTTDLELIKDGVQAINDEFLDWFVKNPSYEELEVVFNNRGISGSEKILKSFGEYKIIIPKEEKLTYSDALKKEERIFNSTMMFKQETIEEVAEKILANNVDGLKDALQDNDLFFFYKGVIQCYGEAMAKWQQEQMYSKEEVIDILMSMPVDSHTNIIEWFQQFKNK